MIEFRIEHKNVLVRGPANGVHKDVLALEMGRLCLRWTSKTTRFAMENYIKYCMPCS
jgi:hypothetical protein